MNDVDLQKIGLNESQARAYVTVLHKSALSAPEVAEDAGVTRTNAYELLEQLVELGLVQKDSSGTKTLYSPTNPVSLRQIILKEQAATKIKSQHLESILPSLLSTYRLGKEQPGVLHLEGQLGLQMLYDDIIRQKQELLIFPSKLSRDSDKVMELIQEQIKRQVKANITCRVIYPDPSPLSPETVVALRASLTEPRSFGNGYFPAQVLVYGNNVAFSTFRQGVVTTIITNEDIAETMRIIFNDMWSKGTVL